MTKREMEQKANRTITSDMPVEMSEKHLTVLRSYGFMFGAKTGSRFIAAVHDIVGIVAAEQIADMHCILDGTKRELHDAKEQAKTAADTIAMLNKEKAVANAAEACAKSEIHDLKAKINDLKLSADLLTAGTGRMAALVTKARNHAAANPNDQQAKTVLHAQERMVRVFNGEETDAEPLSMSMFASKEDYDKAVAAADPMSEAEKVAEAVNRG